VQTFRHLLLICFLFSLSALADERYHLSKGGPNNLGLVMRNENYTLYRSASLGASGLADLAKHLEERRLPFPKTIIYMNRNGYSRSFLRPTAYAVEEYEFSKKYGYEFYHTFRSDYSTYLTHGNPYFPTKDVNSKDLLNEKAVKYFGFHPEMKLEGGMDSFYRILDLVLESKGPVLFHCSGGRHRTGMIGLALRYLQGGAWTQGNFDGPSTYKKLNRAQFEYYQHNKVLFEPENLRFIEQWYRDPKFVEYQKRYQERLNKPSLMDWSRW
jgi:hypothetical protein